MNIKIATIQFHPLKNDVLSNHKNLLSLSKTALSKGAGLIHLPELCTTGYIYNTINDAKKVAESADGKTFALFSKLCIENKCYLAYGFLEKDGESLFNSMNFIGPNGKILLTYRKVHLYEADTKWAHAGDRGFMYYDAPFGRVGFGICMDLNFDDFIEYHIDSGSNIILLSTSWLEEGLPVHKYWLYRIYPYNGIVSVANNYGFDNGIEFCGMSAVIRNQKIVKSASKTENTVLISP